VSQFLFDGLVFDAEYFRQKVAESRERKRELRERVRQMLAESRSNALQLEALEPASASDLFQAIDALTLEAFAAALPLSRNRFDLRRYEAHIQAHLRPIPLSLEQIPPLSEDTRLDRVWRFIALIFLAHAGIVQIWQQGDTIMVIPRETNGERQAVSGDLEEADGVEGTLGRVEA
jgi:chromatin segregation and condensation protein Rec8/ScpA/Scc1 (kleisin family)